MRFFPIEGLIPCAKSALLAAFTLLPLVGAAQSAEGEWPQAARDDANTRFSPLAEIDTGNVAKLREVFSFTTGVLHGHEAAPIVAEGSLYIVTPYPNVVHAFELVPRGLKPKWNFAPDAVPRSQGVACCDTVNRGAAFSKGRLFFNTLDGVTFALEAATGKELWRTQLGDVTKGETITMAPLVVKDKVLVGNSGGEFGARGWLVALDAATGKVAWRAFSTGPDSDVLIGPAFKPFYPSDRGKDLGISTWPGESWKTGGGNAWGWVSYDAALDLVYYGTANPGPWNPEQRPGDNKWTAGIFARRPDGGEAVWFYQWSPHDQHDYDGVNENVLVDLEQGGAPRKVLLHPDRNGYVYVLDRATGQVLSADPFVHITTSLGVDLQTGRLRYAPEKATRVGRTVRDICPAAPGGKDWQPSAWSPRTHLLYIPHQNLCQDAIGSAVSYIAGMPFTGVDTKMMAGPGGHRGELAAWDPIKRAKAWTVRERFPVWSGALVTAGDVVFYGTMDGWFKAIDARSGAPLWQVRTPSGIVGQPVSYRGPDGRQYVAVLSGVGGWAGQVVSGDIDTRDAGGVAGFANAMRDLPGVTQKGGALHVYALP
jgi:PQQ-dependent dehydrogenase (methanol/ethanol family)